MNSFKPILVDILATIFIAVAAWVQARWMWWVIIAYTIFVLIVKGYALYTDESLQWTQINKDNYDKVLHILHALNIILLGLSHWWYPAGLWLLIWLFSYIDKLKKKRT